MPSPMTSMAQKPAMNQMGPGYPLYMPPPNQMAMGAKPSGNPNQQNRMTAYNPHAPMMMNPPPYFNGGMMNYGMPMRNESNEKNKDRQQQPPPYPMYYSNSWGPMMMNPHSMMRQDRAGESMANSVRSQMRVSTLDVPRMHTPKGTPQNMGSGLHPSMNMYMPPYPIDAHYPYIGYPYPPPKKNE